METLILVSGAAVLVSAVILKVLFTNLVSYLVNLYKQEEDFLV
jgi:uncharacterized pyridoxamine 5'-phosphate oxidase family protein